MNASMHDSKSTWVDPDDAPELTDAFFDKATPKIDGKPVSKDRVRTAFKARRGRPPIQSPKLPVSIRLSSEVVEYFRATGSGWQTRIDEALKEYVAAHR